MEALLDTHVLLWWFENAPMLSKRASAILSGPDNPAKLVLPFELRFSPLGGNPLSCKGLH